MVQLKKIFALSLLLFHNMQFADNSLGNIVLGGAAALACVGGGLLLKTHNENAKIELHKKMQEAIESSNTTVEAKNKYGQFFDVSLSNTPSIEDQIESSMVKLGKSLQSINQKNSLISTVRKDLQDFTHLKNKLDNFSSCGNSKVQKAGSQLALYQANAKKITSIFDKHAKFFKGHEILNSYESMPEQEYKVEGWVYSHSEDMESPLSNYKKQVDTDVQFIDDLEPVDLILYPNMEKKLLHMKSKIKNSVIVICKTGNLQVEMQKKHDNEAELARVQVMKNESQAKLTVADAQKRIADAQENLARQKRIENENKSREITALKESARINALRIPTELALIVQTKESNRLKLQENEEKRRLTTAIETQNRLQAGLRHVDNRKFEEQLNMNSRLQSKNKSLESEMQILKKRLLDCQISKDMLQQRPTPSAPPAPGSPAPVIGSASLRQPPFNPNYRSDHDNNRRGN